MREQDVDAAVAVRLTLWDPVAEEDLPRHRSRVEHLVLSDPDGAWVAEEDGAVVGVALAIRRERLWGLSLLGVLEPHRGRGAARSLLGRALDTAADADVALIISSGHPAAMRLYATAGFALHPCVSLGGTARTPPPRPAQVRGAGPQDEAWMDELARAVRGAGYGADLRWWRETGFAMRCVERRGWLVHDAADVECLVAGDAEAATWLLQAMLADAPAGATASIDVLTAEQDWAVAVGLAAGLELSPWGPLFVRGGPLPQRPFLPSGIHL